MDCRAGPETALCTGDCDWACCVRGEGNETTRVAGKDDGAGARAGVRLGHVPDLAGAQEPVGVEVPAVISGERRCWLAVRPLSHGHHLIMLRMACGGALSRLPGRGDG
jgi:hypothetical protein